MKPEISYADFEKIDLRIGTIVEATDFPEARNPSYKLKIDLGPLGIKKSSAQITRYTKEELLGKQVMCVCNFPKKQIGPFMSEVLTTGFDGDGGIILATSESPVENGKQLY